MQKSASLSSLLSALLIGLNTVKVYDILRKAACILPFGKNFLRVLIFAIFPAIRKNKFPKIKITANIFPAKKYIVFSNLNSLHKNTIPRNRVCSITTCLFHSETKRYTTKYWFIVWKYVFLLHVLNKNENIINAGYWVLGTFWKSQKLIFSKEDQSVLIAKK